jgi:hypothetical protein
MFITTKSTVFIPISMKMQAPRTFLTPKNSMKNTVVCPIFTVAMDVFRTSVCPRLRLYHNSSFLYANKRFGQ